MPTRDSPCSDTYDALNIALGFIPILGWVLLPFENLECFALTIIGIVSAAQGGAKPLVL